MKAASPVANGTAIVSARRARGRATGGPASMTGQVSPKHAGPGSESRARGVPGDLLRHQRDAAHERGSVADLHAREIDPARRAVPRLVEAGPLERPAAGFVRA